MSDKSRSRSRTSSLGPTSITGTRSSPSRLVIAPLHQSPSLSNIHIHGHAAPASDEPSLGSSMPPMPQDRLESSASSVINMDINEGILIQDLDTDATNTEEDSTEILHPLITSSEDSKKYLREQLRKTLSGKQVQQEDQNTPALPQKILHPELHGLNLTAATKFMPREYFVLTEAGKPVFISRPGNTNPNAMASTIGIMQALISIFIDDGDKIRSMNAGRTKITFLHRPPLYYVCVSSWGEPESVSRMHLEYLHLQILSIVTAAQLRRIFEKRTNFDLQRLLDGAESFLTSLLIELEFDLSISTSSLHCLKLEPGLRKRIAESLIPASKSKDVLYIMLVAANQVVTLIRPRRHSVHPADVHILLNTIKSPSISNSQASASWIPVCLPKYNPSGFLNAYISYLPDSKNQDFSPPSSAGPHGDSAKNIDHQDGNITLVCISTNNDFETVKDWYETMMKKVSSDGSLRVLNRAICSNHTSYTAAELGIPGLRHFIYKSRSQVQITYPELEDPYNAPNDRRRLLTMYQVLYDAIHAKSGQTELLKLQYIRTDSESVMGWITQPFELYIALSPLLPKSAAIGAANAVVRWVKKEEAKLFLRDAPVL